MLVSYWQSHCCSVFCLFWFSIKFFLLKKKNDHLNKKAILRGGTPLNQSFLCSHSTTHSSYDHSIFLKSILFQSQIRKLTAASKLEWLCWVERLKISMDLVLHYSCLNQLIRSSIRFLCFFIAFCFKQ